MNPLPASAPSLPPTNQHPVAPQSLPQLVVAKLTDLLDGTPAYVQNSARSLLDRIKSGWSLDAEPSPEEANAEEEEEPL